jgi:NodT family efflux transporter outer membrane factor (OMF) lipoprotein
MPLPSRSLAACAATLLLAACTVGPDFQRPAAPSAEGYSGRDDTPLDGPTAPPQHQHAVMGQNLSGAWWRLFRSPQLDAVIGQALANNQTLAAAQSTLDQSLELTTAAGGARYPQLDVAANVNREKLNLSSFGLKGPNPVFNLYQVGPSVSYALDVFGGIRRQIEEQSAQAERQAYEVDAAWLSLTGNVVSQAVTVASVQAQIDTAEGIIADDRQNLDLVRKAQAAGSVSQADVVRAESQLAGDLTILPPLRQQRGLARHALAVLVGAAPAQWSPPPFVLSEFSLPTDLPLSVPSQLVRQRPDILAAEAELHVASAAIGVATARLYPNLTLSASLMQGALFPSQLWTDSASTAIGTAGLTAPLFHGGTLEAERRAAEAAYQASLASYKQTVLQSFAQVADVLEALAHDAEALEAQGNALGSAQDSLRLTRLSFSAGNTGVLQVLDAQRQYEQARLGYVRAEAQRLLDTIQLFLAMGGGWWDWPGRPPVAAETVTQ